MIQKMTKKVIIAKVNSVFGIKGDVKIIIYSDNPEKIEKYELFDAKDNVLKIKITNKNKTVIGTSSGNPIMIAHIEGVNDRNAAELMRGQEIFANRADFDELNADEFYYSDLIGLDVRDMKSKKIGLVKNVLDLGAGGLIEIEFQDPEFKSGYEKIENFPFKNEIFPEVNLDEGFVKIDFPEIIDIKE